MFLCLPCETTLRKFRKEKGQLLYKSHLLSFSASYEGRYKELLLQLKFKGETYLSKGIAHIMLLNGFYKEMDANVLVPVPMGPFKEQVRGFNQSEKIAVYLGRLLGLEVRNILGKKDHPPLSGIKGRQREETIQGSMYLRENVAGKRILLIDDVFTTGATMRECIRTLERGQAGALFAMIFLKKERKAPSWD